MMPRPMNPITCAIGPPRSVLNEVTIISTPARRGSRDGRSARRARADQGHRADRSPPGVWSGGRLCFLAPEVLRQPVEPEILQRFRPRLAGLAVEADLGVPGVEHLLPLRADGLTLRGPVHRRRAVAARGILEGAGVAAAQGGGAVDRGSAAPELQGLCDGEVPAGRRREGAAEVLEPGPRREDADAERVLEAPSSAQPGDVLGDLLAVEGVDPRGLPDLRRMHGVPRLHRRGGRRARVEHLLPSRAMIVAARRGALLDVDRAFLGGPAQFFGGALDALGQEVPQPLPATDHLKETVGALDVAPLELDAELLAGDAALLLALHDPAAEPTPLVDVHARAVALAVEPRHAVAVGRTDRPSAAGPAFVLRLIDDRALLGALPDDRHVAVVHAAGVALVAAVVEVLAELGRLPHAQVGAGDVRGQVRRVVLDRQGAHLREIHDAGQRAVLVERARRRVRAEVVGDVVGRLDHAARIGGAQGLRPLDDRDRLEPLLAHDGAAAVLGRDVAVVALDGGEAHEALAGRSDRVDRQLVAHEPRLPVERALGFPRVQADQRARVAELHDVVVDVEIDPVLRLPLDDDRVVSAVFQIRPEEPVGLGRGRAVGAGADGADGEAARAPHRQARERARAQHEPVVGMVPGDVALAALRRRLAVEDHRAEPDAAEQLPHRLGAPRLGPAGPAREVDAQEIAGEAAGPRGRGGLCLGLLRRVYGRWSHTATGVSPGAFDGRPKMVSGSSVLVVFVAMKAGLTSNGFFFK